MNDPYSDLGSRLTRSEALETYCSLCGAAAGQPCRFVETANTRRTSVVSARVQQLRDRVGTPTKRPHNDRHRSEYQRLTDFLRTYGDVLMGVPQ